jgi:hypothetical protein
MKENLEKHRNLMMCAVITRKKMRYSRHVEIMSESRIAQNIRVNKPPH